MRDKEDLAEGSAGRAASSEPAAAASPVAAPKLEGWRPDVCLYHAKCDDGFAAAWAVWKRWGDAVAYVPMHYGDHPLPDIAGKRVLMVDFSLKREALIEAGKAADTVVVLDHHKTALDELAEFLLLPGVLAAEERFTPEVVARVVAATPEAGMRIFADFDMDNSGCRLAWEFCHPGQPMPRLLEHIEDRDLWRFKLETTKRVSAALRSHDHWFERFDQWVADDVGAILALTIQGAAILRAQERHVSDFLDQAYMAEVAGYTVPVCNVPYAYSSDCGHALLKRYPEAPFAATWWRLGGGREGWSLRSEDARVDVSKIAASLGGGGHRNASGFTLPALTSMQSERHLMNDKDGD
jgi:hypothetical protein